MLERSFEAGNKLEPKRKSELAKKLGLKPRQVAVQFENCRARWKTKQLERGYDHLKAAYNLLLADHNSLLKDNDHLRSQDMKLFREPPSPEKTSAKILTRGDNRDPPVGAIYSLVGSYIAELVDKLSGDAWTLAMCMKHMLISRRRAAL